MTASWPVHISEAARLSGVSAKMLRHYEALGLLGEVPRTDSGYRLYAEKDVHTLRFIRRARELGFSMADIQELVSLWHNQQRSSASVRQIAQRHVEALTRRMDAMHTMQATLQHLIHGCQGNDRPECPILDDLANPSSPTCHG